MNKRLRSAKKKLDTIYSRLPETHCKGLCQDNCSVISMTGLELAIINERHPHRKTESEGLLCPCLGSDGRCLIYEDRPLICRAFGAVENLECEHGCGVSILKEAQARKAFQDAFKLSESAGMPKVAHLTRSQQSVSDFIDGQSSILKID